MRSNAWRGVAAGFLEDESCQKLLPDPYDYDDPYDPV